MRIQPSLGPIKTSIGGGSSNIGGEDYMKPGGTGPIAGPVLPSIEGTTI